MFNAGVSTTGFLVGFSQSRAIRTATLALPSLRRPSPTVAVSSGEWSPSFTRSAIRSSESAAATPSATFLQRLMLIEAALKAGRFALARALTAERIALKPNSALAWAHHAAALKGCGDLDGVARARAGASGTGSVAQRPSPLPATTVAPWGLHVKAPVVWDHMRDAPRNHRCRQQGGLSTGPTSPEGRRGRGPRAVPNVTGISERYARARRCATQ